MISFFIPGRPVPQARPRVVHGGKRTYDPKRSADAKIAAGMYALAARLKANAALMETEAITVTLEARFAYPKGTSKARQIDRAPLTGRPDVENISKMVLDAMTGIIYADDSQVWSLHASKFRVVDSEEEGIHVRVDY